MLKKHFKPGFTLLLSALLFALASMVLTVSHSVAQEETLPHLAPLNPDFCAYLENRAGASGSGEHHPFGEDRAPGYVPPPFDRSHLQAPLRKEHYPQSYPATYDLRTVGRVTPVKNQGSCGCCWAFATFASLESYLLPGESWDFSENNLKNTHGFDMPHDCGGNDTMAAAYLARWSGPVSEEDDPFNPSSGSSPSAPLALQKKIQNVTWMPGREAAQNPEWLKKAIMEGGAVYTSMYFDGPIGSTAWRADTSSYYYSASASTISNHDVVIIGWDDNFNNANFLISPPGNGAFIARNSWGTHWGEEGYFYVSYYDEVFGRKHNTLFHNAEAPECYDNIYQYDPLGCCYSITFNNDSIWGANIFRACSDEHLTAVSFYTCDNNTGYEIEIYTGARTEAPRGGVRQLVHAGSALCAGYHTVNLSKPVELNAEELFSIAIKFSLPGGKAYLALEAPIENYSSGATANAGESFFSSNGTNWLDPVTYDKLDLRGSNICIKAFTNYPVEINVTAEPAGGGSVTGGGAYSKGSQVTLKAYPGKDYSFVSWREGETTVSTDNVYTFTASASRELTACFIPTGSLLYGDINCDGVIDVSDAIMVLRRIVGLIHFTPAQEETADMNNNGVIDVGDAIMILRIIVGL